MASSAIEIVKSDFLNGDHRLAAVVTTDFAEAVRQLGRSTPGAFHHVNRGQCVVGATLALSRFRDSSFRNCHSNTVGRISTAPGDESPSKIASFGRGEEKQRKRF
jgi:hypothetical protein